MLTEQKYKAYPNKNAGGPTATKDSGTEWYYPAIVSEFGRPVRIIGGCRFDSRGKAKTAAKKMLDKAT